MEGQAALPSWLSRCPFLGAPGEAQHTQAGEGRVVLRQKEKLQQRQAEEEAGQGRRQRQYFELQCGQYKREVLPARHSLDEDLLREVDHPLPVPLPDPRHLHPFAFASLVVAFPLCPHSCYGSASFQHLFHFSCPPDPARVPRPARSLVPFHLSPAPRLSPPSAPSAEESWGSHFLDTNKAFGPVSGPCLSFASGLEQETDTEGIGACIAATAA